MSMGNFVEACFQAYHNEIGMVFGHGCDGVVFSDYEIWMAKFQIKLGSTPWILTSPTLYSG